MGKVENTFWRGANVMTALEAIEILKTDMGCYECTVGCSTPYECANGGCPFREAIHLAVERLSIDILPKMIKAEQTEPQTYITEDRDTQILDAWQVHHRNTTSIEDEPQREVIACPIIDDDAWIYKDEPQTDCGWK